MKHIFNTSKRLSASMVFGLVFIFFAGHLFAGVPVITAGSIIGVPFCYSSRYSVPVTVHFSSSGVFDSGNVYTAEISNAGGSYASPVSIGTLSSTSTGSLTIFGSITGGTAAGNSYKIRIISSAPSVTGSSSAAFSINAPPDVNADTNKSVCIGSSISIGSAAVTGNIYSWSSYPAGFSDTSANPLVSPTITTNYFLTQKDTLTGCSNTASLVITVTHPLPPAGITETVKYLCAGASDSLTDTSTYTGPQNKYLWSFIDLDAGVQYSMAGKGVNFMPPVWGRYEVTLLVSNGGCNTTLTDSNYFTVYSVFPNFLVDTTGYANAPLYFTNTSKSSPNSKANSKLLFQWDFGDSSATDTAANPSHTYTLPGIYTVNLTATNDSTGCSNSITKLITINFTSVSALIYANDTNCAYTPVSFFDSSKSLGCGTINKWLWAFGDNNTSASQNPTHTYNAAGYYTVKLTVSSSGGCTDSITENIFVDSTCVWPGDANNDKVADTDDVLYIGIAYGDNGPKRTNATTNWVGQYCDNWGNRFANGADYKHADCNGDGVVDSNDIKAIVLNYGATHLKTGLTGTGDSTNPYFYLSFSKTVYKPGDTVNAAIMLGTAANSLGNVYGMASAFHFTPAYVDTNTLKINFNNSWFGTPGKNMLTFTRREYSSGELLFAITRIDHIGASGSGSIGAISFVIPQNAADSNSVIFGPNAAKLILFNQTIIPLYLPVDTFSVQTPTGIRNTDNVDMDLKISPNPFVSTLYITYTLPQSQDVQLTISDITGKEIAALANENQTQGFHIYNFDADKYNIPAGVYFVRMVVGNEVIEEKVVRIR